MISHGFNVEINYLRVRKGVTEKQKELIIIYHLEYKSDREIARVLDLNVGTVANITTKYWADKMKNKG